MNNVMISLQEVWEAAGGNKLIVAEKEATILVLKQLDKCVNTQEREIQQFEKENHTLKGMLSRLVKENDLAMPNENYQWMYSPMREECLKLLKGYI